MIRGIKINYYNIQRKQNKYLNIMWVQLKLTICNYIGKR